MPITLHTHARFSCAVVVAFSVLLSSGCDKNNPVSEESSYQDADLLPISTGRLWIFTAYELDTTASQKITSTVHREVSFVAGTATVAGKTCFLMLDSIYTSSGTLAAVDSSYLAIENGDMFQWDQGHAIWLTMLKKSAGLNTEYSIAQYQEVHDGVAVSVAFKGKVTPAEPVTAPIGTVQAYKVEIKVTATIAGVSYDAQTLYFYLADKYGQVRMYTPVQREMGSGSKSKGEESMLVSKNF